MRSLIGVCFLLFALASEAQTSPASATAAPGKAGTVDFIEGDVRIQRTDGTPAQPAVGTIVYERDSIATGADGEVHLKMEDGGVLAMRPKSKIVIAQYRADGDAADRSILRLIHGGLRSISGWIAKFNPKGYEIRTNMGVIGIRGTDHDTQLRLRGDAEGEAGLYDRVYAGRTVIRSKKGQVEVTPDRAGFSSAKPGKPPRLLDKIPAFFRPTRNEGRLEGLHEKIQQTLEKKRAERQNEVKEQRAKKSAKRAREPKEKARHKSP